MFTVKLKQLVDFKNCTDVFAGAGPIRVAFILEKIKGTLNTELPFYQSKITEIMNDCAMFDEEGGLVKSEDGNGFMLKEDKVADFYTRFGELEDIEVSIPCDKIKLSDIEDLNIKVELMQYLMPFIDEE